MHVWFCRAKFVRRHRVAISDFVLRVTWTRTGTDLDWSHTLRHRGKSHADGGPERLVAGRAWCGPYPPRCALDVAENGAWGIISIAGVALSQRWILFLLHFMARVSPSDIGPNISRHALSLACKAQYTGHNIALIKANAQSLTPTIYYVFFRYLLAYGQYTTPKWRVATQILLTLRFAFRSQLTANPRNTPPFLLQKKRR